MELQINNEIHEVDVEADMPLLWVLRDIMNLKGTKFGCGISQCGYCQSGQIMTAVSLLAKKPQPSDADINAAMTNLCRCGTYKRIRDAIHDVAGNNPETTLAYEA